MIVFNLVKKIKKHPLARAVRGDKMCLAALSATLTHYLKGEAERTVPIWQMISAESETLFDRATKWRDSLGSGEVVDNLSTIGGGTISTAGPGTLRRRDLH